MPVPNIFWSSRLELLADKLFEQCRQTTLQTAEPFAKICVVVSDTATQEWLKQYYLIARKNKSILFNLDFQIIDNVTNDWLAAQTHGISPRDRHASLHPYAAGNMAWRIYGILEQAQDDPVFAPLKHYIGTEERTIPLRRYALSEKLAKLYDDYLLSRFQVLVSWENGEATQYDSIIPPWQPELYRRLVLQNPATYACDYRNALNDNSDASQATTHGFPRYLAVHVFDIPFISEPTLSLLEKISGLAPMTFWLFNPTGDWLGDSYSQKEMTRALRAHLNAQRKALHNNDLPPEENPLDETLLLGSPEERLLGVLASGARPLLGLLLDKNLASQEDVLDDNTGYLNFPKHIAVHSAYSPQRELEIIKNGLMDFLKQPGHSPHDALVLCADWNTYAPIFESVFTTDVTSPDFFPITVAGGIAVDPPITQSFANLLAFRSNRFQYSAVMNLLSVEPLRQKAGLNTDDIALLKTSLAEANIRWGRDDADIASQLGTPYEEKPCSFTWQRGLDRLTLDWLYGEPTSGDEYLTLPNLGELRHAGHIEGHKAAVLALLNAFISRLYTLRKTFAPGNQQTAAQWSTALMDTLADFYETNDDSLADLTRIRRAITNTTTAAEAAMQETPIDVDVFLTAVQNAITCSVPGTKTPADAVVFAPLTCATATPHKQIWLCGLNDGAFPRMSHRSSFDIIGKHPTAYDVSSREKDAYALLKAALSARENLSFSYIGKNVHTNEIIPPSILLTEITEYLNTSGQAYESQTHPLHGFNPKYWTEDVPFPRNYSHAQYAIAQNLVQRENTDQNIPTLAPFAFNPDGVTELSLEVLCDFYAHPHTFINKALKLPSIWLDKPQDDEVIEMPVGKRLLTDIILNDQWSDADTQETAKFALETGMASTKANAVTALTEAARGDKVNGLRNLTIKKGWPQEYKFAMPILDAYKQFLAIPNPQHTLEFHTQIDGHEVVLHASFKLLTLQTLQNTPQNYAFAMENSSEVYESTQAVNWIRHLAGHALGLNFVTILCCQAEKPPNKIFPLAQAEAQAKLIEVLQAAFRPLPPGYPDATKANNPKADTPYLWDSILKPEK